MKDGLLTKREVADFLSISLRTVDRMIADQQITPIRIRGQVRFDPKEIQAIIERKGTKD